MRWFLTAMLAEATEQGWGDEPVLKLEFSGAAPEANRVTTDGAGCSGCE